MNKIKETMRCTRDLPTDLVAWSAAWATITNQSLNTITADAMYLYYQQHAEDYPDGPKVNYRPADEHDGRRRRRKAE